MRAYVIILTAASLYLGGITAAVAQTNPAATITVDAQADRHPISPMIYGVCFGTESQMKALNFTVNRIGGNNFSRYNWKVNTVNIDNDWYFESIPGRYFPGPPKSLVPGARVDTFIAETKAAGAQPLITIPMIGWVAKVVDPNKTLSSFSVAKYGPQQKAAPEDADAGNGIRPDGTKITGNDPNDADVPSNVDFQRGWVQHLIGKWGTAAQGGVRYYIMDNEPALWSSTHFDIHPQGETSQEDLDDIIAYGSMVKSLDPGAQIVGPEEWGWGGYFESGAGGEYAAAHGYTTDTPERRARGGMDNLPWLLDQLHKHDLATGKRLLDIFSVHIYPQGGDGGDDVSEKIELLRNRDTRQLWDPAYVDESWINKPVMLIPRLKQWVAAYYPGTKIAITEYNWGAEKTMNGATAQADILGILGRENVDIATRWQAPDESTPTFKAMQMYRNYDGQDSTFGDVSVSDKPSANPDDLSSFAAVRQTGGALTVMVVNKDLTGSTPVTLNVQDYNAAAVAQVWQLTTANAIQRQPDATVASGQIQSVVPPQSVTLFVFAQGAKP
jgi:hypothetical protein